MSISMCIIESHSLFLCVSVWGHVYITICCVNVVLADKIDQVILQQDNSTFITEFDNKEWFGSQKGPISKSLSGCLLCQYTHSLGHKGFILRVCRENTIVVGSYNRQLARRAGIDISP